MTAIPNFQPQEVFNYKEYLESMESKILMLIGKALIFISGIIFLSSRDK